MMDLISFWAAAAVLPISTMAFMLPPSHVQTNLRDLPTFTALSERTTSEELIPLDVLFGNPENTSPLLSPDGRYLAYLAPYNQVMNIYVRDLAAVDHSATNQQESGWDKSRDRRITEEPTRGIRSIAWAYDNTTVFYMQDTAGDENFHLYAVDITQQSSSEDTGIPPARDLTPGENVKAQNIITNYRYPNEILVGTNERNAKVFDMYRCFYKTGEKYLDTLNPGDVIGWKTEDISFEIRAATVRNEADSSTTIRVRKSADIIGSDNEEDTEWKDMFHFPYGEEGGLLDFCPDLKTAYLTSSLGRETTALLKVNIETGDTLEEIYSNDKCNVGGVTLDKDSKEIKALTYNYARTVSRKAITKKIHWIQTLIVAFLILYSFCCESYLKLCSGTHILRQRIRRRLRIPQSQRPRKRRSRCRKSNPR